MSEAQIPAAKPKFLRLFWTPSDRAGCIYLSEYKTSEEDWESNHIEFMIELRCPSDKVAVGCSTGILSNIIGSALYSQTGCTLILLEDK